MPPVPSRSFKLLHGTTRLILKWKVEARFGNIEVLTAEKASIIYYWAATTILFLILPMPSISISTTSPSLSQFRGCKNAATPLLVEGQLNLYCEFDAYFGVPVMMIVPFRSVIP